MPRTGAAPHPLQRLAGHPDVAEAAESARTAVDRLLRHRILRRRSAELTAESALRGARASAALAGVDWTLEAVRGVRGPAADPEAAVIHGALRVSAGVGSLAPIWRRSPLQVLARLHVLAAADLEPGEVLGRPVTGGARMAGLAELVSGPAGAPAVVEAAVVHGELLAAEPFPVGTGLVARAAQRLVLVTRGLDPKSMVPAEVGHAGRAEDYAGAAAGYRNGTPAEVVAWVVHCARAVEEGARDGLAYCEALSRTP